MNFIHEEYEGRKIKGTIDIKEVKNALKHVPQSIHSMIVKAPIHCHGYCLNIYKVLWPSEFNVKMFSNQSDATDWLSTN
ncbi:MAG: hypothetical protein ACI9G9_000357 [Psychromonas sp.]|jgi:hypothetical protein